MFWSIDSSTQYLETLTTSDVYNVQIYDFTTLYTKLDLCEVDYMIGEIIDLIFTEKINILTYVSMIIANASFLKRSMMDAIALTKINLKKLLIILFATYTIVHLISATLY